MALFRKPADPEDGRLMSQNNHLMDTGAWQATAVGVTESQTLLNN